MADPTRLKAVDAGTDRDAVESAVFEIKRVIAGQDEMLERVFVCLLAGGHLLIEGVPGLAKTLTIKTVAEVIGGTFQRVQFTPDLVPSDLVGTRMYRAGKDEFDIELGPVFCNFLLADEINRAPAKVQSALLEVMQERQVTIGKETHAVPSPFLVMATQNPIESEGTYPLPEAQVDRFMLKVLVDYPEPADELTVIERALADPVKVEQLLTVEELAELQAAARRIYVDPAVSRYALSIALATRRLADAGLEDLAAYVDYGASPRGPDQPRRRRARPRASARPPLRAAAGRPRARPRTCSGTGWCSATRRSPKASTRIRSSTACSRRSQMPQLDLARQDVA